MKLAKFSVFCTVVALILSLVGCLPPAHAEVTPEVGAGITRYNIADNGTWYQSGVTDNSVSRNGRAFQVGLTDHYLLTQNYGVAWHVDYVNLGHIRSYCDCTTIDADYNRLTHVMQPGAPTAIYSGNGLVQGFQALISPYYMAYGWKFGGNFGLYQYRPGYTESVYGWTIGGPGPRVNATLTTTTSPHLAPVAGFFVSKGRVTLSYLFYWMPTRPNEYNVPPLYNGAQVLMVSYAL
jgi:hypothetical protein